MTSETSQKTNSSAETQRFAQKLAPQLQGQNIFLFGALGVGKTTFVRGLARAYGLRQPIKSPTFVTALNYQLREHELLHVDFYRLTKITLAEISHFQEAWLDPKTTFISEWSERLPQKFLPCPRFEFSFTENAEQQREILWKKIPGAKRRIAAQRRICL